MFVKIVPFCVDDSKSKLRPHPAHHSTFECRNYNVHEVRGKFGAQEIEFQIGEPLSNPTPFIVMYMYDDSGACVSACIVNAMIYILNAEGKTIDSYEA